MAGAFDGLLSGGDWSYDDPASYRQANLSKDEIDQLVRMYEQRNDRSGGVRQDNGLTYGRANIYAGGVGDAWSPPTDVKYDQYGDIEGSGGFSRKVGDTKYYDFWNQDGTYDGRRLEESSSVNFRNFLIAAGAMYGGGMAFENAVAAGGTAPTAASLGATDLGIGAVSTGTGATGGLTAAGATSAGVSAAEQIAFLSANGMTDATIAASFPELAAAGGLTGVGGGAAAVAGATNWIDSAKTGLQTVGDGMKTLGISGGDLLKTGAAVALAKDVKGPQADPNLSSAINGLKGTADDANARAQSNDEYWRTTFAPRYLRAMDDQIAMGRELNNFNMGLARKYDDRYWNTTAKQQDAFYDQVNNYDTDAARARFAGEAGANSDMQNAAAMQALMRDLNRRGVNPNSGVYLSNQRQQAQQGALQKTMAMNMAREAARKEGLNMRAVAAGLGGNLTGASAGFAGQAAQSAGLGMNGIQGANNGFNSSVGNWNATTGLGINAMNSVGNWGLGLTQGNARANELNTQGFNQMIGYGLGMFGSGK